MATRDENLKKINAELDKLSDEQLEKIAGGVPILSPEFGFGIDEDNKNQNQRLLMTL